MDVENFVRDSKKFAWGKGIDPVRFLIRIIEEMENDCDLTAENAFALVKKKELAGDNL